MLRRRSPASGGLAVVTPLPPQHTGIAAYSARLLEAVAALEETHVFLDGEAGEAPPLAPAGVHVHPLAELERHDRDAPHLYCFGNSPFHLGAWRELRRFGGDALLHEVALWGLYLSLEAGGVLPAGGARERALALEGRTIEEMIDDRCAMVAEIVGSARRVFVHTDLARTLLVERHPDRAADIAVVTFALPPVVDGPAPPGGPPVVASFGHQRAAELVGEAFVEIAAEVPDALLWLVGAEHFGGQMEPLVARLHDAGLGDRVTVTGWVEDPEYRRRMAATTVAIQPRLFSYGERSAALGDLLSAGVATVASAASHADGVPDDAIVLVEPAEGAGGLARAALALLREDSRRSALRSGALAYAATHGAERAARDLLDAMAR
jgi:glycosyltransferase involved in cell wall biosynthesis